ncbi:MAG: hypothetical protein PHE55_12255 [Methylococcaceae bacterium]|nr:hypothetical protein [Methylococcaceae bacterium]
MATIAEYLIYALGGGQGHARRGLLLQRWLTEQGIASEVLLCPGADRHMSEDTGPRHYAQSLSDSRLMKLLRSPPPRLVVDTFPCGWQGEIDGEFLARFERRYWIARYSRDVIDIPRCYDRILLPYPRGYDEWNRHWSRSRYAGYMIDRSHLRFVPDRCHFTVVDPEGRCGPRILSIFKRLARRAGLIWRHRRALGPVLEACKLLVVGAGYHSFYELLGQGIDVRFLPVKKRHDDQFRRADRFGLAITHLDQLLPWLLGPPLPTLECPVADWAAVLQCLET